MIDLKLDGKVAIVTGASRGLGRATAQALIEQGVRVLAAARTVEDLESLRSCRTARRSRCGRATCSMRSPCRACPPRRWPQFGRLDIVVNNAGIAPAGSFLEQADQVWNDVIAVNVTAPAILTRAAGRILIAQGSGKVINIASTSGILGKPQLVAYSASKGALLQFTKALAGGMGRQRRASQRRRAGRIRHRCAGGGAGVSGRPRATLAQDPGQAHGP